MQSQSPHIVQEPFRPNQIALPKQSDTDSQKALVENNPVPEVPKAKAMAASSEPGTEYWLP
jgi:hypothetical protein